MNGHSIVHRAPGVSLKAHVTIDRMSARRWRLEEKRQAVAALLFVGRRVWEPEETARQGRRRSLIDDNPTAG